MSPQRITLAAVDGKHRKADHEHIWWFPVWQRARLSPSYHASLYRSWLADFGSGVSA